MQFLLILQAPLYHSPITNPSWLISYYVYYRSEYLYTVVLIFTLRDISYPAVDPQQSATVTQSPSPDEIRSADTSLRPQQPQQDQQTTQGHVTWDWINDIPERNPFEMTIEEIEGLADPLTENDWTEWNLGESSGTFWNMLEDDRSWQNSQIDE